MGFEERSWDAMDADCGMAAGRARDKGWPPWSMGFEPLRTVAHWVALGPPDGPGPRAAWLIHLRRLARGEPIRERRASPGCSLVRAVRVPHPGGSSDVDSWDGLKAPVRAWTEVLEAEAGTACLADVREVLGS